MTPFFVNDAFLSSESMAMPVKLLNACISPLASLHAELNVGGHSLAS